MNTKNFTDSEFACKCCGKNFTDQKVLNLCQKIRDFLNVPVRVNCGYRCPKHNAEVGGVKNSNHTKGLAADLSCALGPSALFNAVKTLYSQGKIPELGYCIRYGWGIHVDVLKRKSGNLWEIRK